MAATSQNVQPSPAAFFEAVAGFQKAAALKGAVELDLFTAIADGATTSAALAQKCQASERGTRILCDFLTVHGFLLKAEGHYSLTPDSAVFLSRHSPAYLGSVVNFMLHPLHITRYSDVAGTVRKGGTLGDAAPLETDHPIWAEFARSMAPLMFMPAQEIAGLLGAESGETWKVLDIAAGHGLFGIAIAQKNPNARIVALDWPHVLEVARENAARMGVADRHSIIEGDAFAASFGSGYDVVLVTNFLHQFDPASCEGILKKSAQALKPGGRAVILEYVPNEDRVSPPAAGAFAFTMLNSTPRGDTYTFAQLRDMASAAGFRTATLHPLSNGMESVVIATK